VGPVARGVVVSVQAARNGFTYTFESQADADAFTAAQDAAEAARLPVQSWRVQALQEPHEHLSVWACAKGDHGACNPRPPLVVTFPGMIQCRRCLAEDTVNVFPQVQRCECDCHPVNRAGQAGGVR
jgi:dsDNA-binding SOS-regulon protein